MRTLAITIQILYFFSNYIVFAQDDIINVTRIVPLYCIKDIVEEKDLVVIDSRNDYDYSCIDKVRITFANSDLLNIRKLIFKLSLYDPYDKQLLYRAKHEVDIKILPEEVITYDLQLINKISASEEINKTNKLEWEVEIIKIND
jgi:hypothetical protein